MKIVLVNTYYPPDGSGGAERSVQILAEGLQALGHEVSAVVTAPAGPARTSVRNGIQVTALPIRNVYRDPVKPLAAVLKPIWHALDSQNPLMRGTLRDAFASATPDIVHTNTLAGLSVAAWRAARDLQIPVVHTLRDYYLLCPKATMFRNGEVCLKVCPVCRAYAMPKAHGTRLVDAVVGLGAAILERHMAEGLFRDARHRSVIPNAVQPPEVTEDRGPSKHPGLRLGYLGRLDPSKGPDLLLAAASRLEPSSLEVVVAGMGKAEYSAELQRQYSGARVRFVGHIPAAELFNQIDFLVVPSRWIEPFARVVVEALAAGIPVICSRHIGAAEFVLDGETGYRFDSGDVPGLSALLSRLTRADAIRMAPRCRTAVASLTPERIAVRYAEVYQQVAR